MLLIIIRIPTSDSSNVTLLQLAHNYNFLPLKKIKLNKQNSFYIN